MQLIAEKIHDEPDDDDERANADDVFSRLRFHNWQNANTGPQKIGLDLNMRIILIALLISFGLPLLAQDSVRLSWNTKTILTGDIEKGDSNTVVISQKDLQSKKDLVITYVEKQKPKDWKRTITLYDVSGKEIRKMAGNTMRITNVQLRALLKKYKTIDIYTWALPTDPKMQAAVRIRRILLARITK